MKLFKSNKFSKSISKYKKDFEISREIKSYRKRYKPKLTTIYEDNKPAIKVPKWGFPDSPQILNKKILRAKIKRKIVYWRRPTGKVIIIFKSK